MRSKNFLSIALRIIIAGIFLQTLYFKFTAHPESVHIFSALGAEPYGRIGLGIIELLTSILILLPRTKLIGIFMSLGIIFGAIFSHFLVLGFSVNGDGGVLFVLALIVLMSAVALVILHRQEFQSLVSKLLRS